MAKYFVSYVVEMGADYVPGSMVTDEATTDPAFVDVDSFADLASGIAMQLARDETGEAEPSDDAIHPVHITNVVRLPL